jgi:protocatechuate 3,4-dioxygenase beta subunit
MNRNGKISEIAMMDRRHLLRTAAKIGAIAAVSQVKSAVAQPRLRPTPDQILGPFFPLGKTPDPGGDLTHLPGKSERASGQLLNVMGRVLNAKGEPVRGAKLEVWQANAAGRYTHPSDANPAPLDPNFDGFALLTTDAEGGYRFKTIKPGGYPRRTRTHSPAAHSLRRARGGRRPGHTNVFRGRARERQGLVPAKHSSARQKPTDRRTARANVGLRGGFQAGGLRYRAEQRLTIPEVFAAQGSPAEARYARPNVRKWRRAQLVSATL